MDDSSSIPDDANPLKGRKTLIDFKTLSCGGVYSLKNLEPSEAVQKREAKVNSDYHSKAVSLENHFGLLPIQGQTIGPIKSVLNSYGKGYKF